MADYREFLVHQIEVDTAEMRGLVQHFPPDRWNWRPGPQLWTAWEHLNHARNVERRYLEQLEGVLEHGEYAPSARPATEPEDQDETPLALVDDYSGLRHREIDIFQALSADQWRQEFNHPTLWGHVSVQWWAERVVAHTTEHLQGLWMLRQLTAIDPDRIHALTA